MSSEKSQEEQELIQLVNLIKQSNGKIELPPEDKQEELHTFFIIFINEIDYDAINHHIRKYFNHLNYRVGEILPQKGELYRFTVSPGNDLGHIITENDLLKLMYRIDVMLHKEEILAQVIAKNKIPIKFAKDVLVSWDPVKQKGLDPNILDYLGIDYEIEN